MNTFKSFAISAACAAATLASVVLSPSAHAGPGLLVQGTEMNGVTFNTLKLNTLKLNGPGIGIQGVEQNGTRIHCPDRDIGCPQAAGNNADRQVLAVTLADGQTIELR